MKKKFINQYIISFMALFLTISCTSNNKVVNKNDNQENKKIPDIISTQEEKDFFNKNIIPEKRSGFYDIFFSYMEGDYQKFYKKSEKFLENKQNPEILKLWVELKVFTLFKKDILSFENVNNLYKNNMNLKFTPLLLKEVENLYKSYFKLENSAVKNLYSMNKWSLSGPYKLTDTSKLKDFDFGKKYDDIFVENKFVDFKEGNINIPYFLDKAYGGVYKLETYVYIDDEEFNLYLNNLISGLLIKIDDEVILNNDSLSNSENKDVINVKLRKGIHKFTVIFNDFNKEFSIYSDKKLSFKKSDSAVAKGKIEHSSLVGGIAENVYKISDKYSYSFKNIIISEIIIDLTNNADMFYKYLTKVKKDNFYRDYLYYNFYNNIWGVGLGVKSKYMQKYLKLSLKKNKNFYKTRMEYVILQNKPNPYQVLDDLNDMPKTLWVYKLLATYYKKANLLSEYENTINKIYSMNNGALFLYKYFLNDMRIYNYDLYTKIYQKFKNKLLYKNDYNEDDVEYIVKEIKKAPYSKTTLYLLSALKEIDRKLFLKFNFKNFKSEFIKEKVNLSGKKPEDLINVKNEKYFIRANFFLKKWKKFVKFKSNREIIENFKKHLIKEEFPTTKLLDYDIAFVEKDYWFLLNRRIIKINNSQGLRKYSNLRRGNYLKIVTISNSDLKEYEPSFTQNTSEISLKKLKVGDYIELITYQSSVINPETPLGRIVAFRYKDFNQTVINAKLDLYIDNYFNKGSRKLYLNSINNFDLSRVKSKKIDHYTLYTYRDNHLFGIKTEPFSFRRGDLLFPSLDISSKSTWKDIYAKLQLFYDYLSYSNYSDTVINKYRDIKSVEDLKELYYTINKDMKHINSYYGFFDSTYLNKQGNLVYFMKMILDRKKIKNNILVFHNKYNFLDTEDIPRLSYYNVFVLKVELNKKFYYLDFSDKWNEFNELSPSLYGQFYLRIDNDKNIFKEQFKENNKLKTKTNIDIKVNQEGNAEISLKITIPGILSSALKGFFTTQSKDRVNMILNAIISRKLGAIKDFKLNIKNSDIAKLPLIISVDFSKDNFVEKKDNKLIITSFLEKEFSSQLYSYAVLKDYTILDKRTLPLLVYYFNDIYTLNITFPEGYKVAPLKEIKLKNQFADYILTKTIKNNKISITRNYFIDSNKIETKDYKLLKDMAEKIKKIKIQDIIAEKK